MAEEPERKVLDPKKVEQTAHNMVTILYEGFVSVTKLMAQLKEENEGLRTEKVRLQGRVDGLLDKFLNGDENGTKNESTDPDSA